jgi:hypothetical protein
MNPENCTWRPNSLILAETRFKPILEEWILQKVILMMGIFDGCRDELFKMMINDAEDNFEVVNPTLVVKILISRTGVSILGPPNSWSNKLT